MARRRNSSRRRRSSSSRRRRRSGTRGLKGVKGLGQLRVKGPVRDTMPAVLGLGLAGGTALALRGFVEPTPGSNQAAIYRWAPAIGAGVGSLGALAMYAVAGGGPATSTFLTSVLGSGLIMASERVHLAKGPGAIAALQAGGGNGEMAGLRAIVPERAGMKSLRGDGMGAVVMEDVKGLGQYGEEIGLRGSGMAGTVNQGAFGTESFQG